MSQPGIDFLLSSITRNRFLPVPPQHRWFPRTGGENFLASGAATLRDLIDSGLKPTHDVLDIGSGLGRVAVPLTQYIDENNKYIGIDILFDALSWCNEHIAQIYENFTFKLIDVENPYYNKSPVRLVDIDLPVKDAFADFVVVNSVFTHLHPEQVEWYLRQMAAKTKPGGLVWCTWFLYTEESAALTKEGKARYTMLYSDDKKAYYTSEEKSTVCVAYPPEFVLPMIEKYGFNLARDICYGSWCGREQRSVSRSIAQDVLLLERC